MATEGDFPEMKPSDAETFRPFYSLLRQDHHALDPPFCSLSFFLFVPHSSPLSPPLFFFLWSLARRKRNPLHFSVSFFKTTQKVPSILLFWRQCLPATRATKIISLTTEILSPEKSWRCWAADQINHLPVSEKYMDSVIPEISVFPTRTKLSMIYWKSALALNSKYDNKHRT